MHVSDPEQVLDRTVVDPDGAKIGTVTEVYLDEFADRAGWIAVRTGAFGHHVSPVPLAGAAMIDDSVVVPYSKDQVRNAPHHDPEMALSREEEAALFAHYGFGYDEREASAVTGAPGHEPTIAEATTEDAARGDAEAGLHEGAGQSSRTRLRGLAGAARQPSDAVKAEALAADPDEAPSAGGRELPDIDVTEPPVYADDAITEEMQEAQVRRADATRRREERGY